MAQIIYYHDPKGRIIPIDADHPVAVELMNDITVVFEIVNEQNINSTFNTVGNNTVVPAPGAGVRLVVSAFAIQNQSAVATTMILHSGGSANDGWQILGQGQGDGLAIAFSGGREWRLGNNEALIFNLSGNNQCCCSVQYFTEPVA